MEKELTTQQLVSGLIKVGHKSLAEYIPDSMKVVKQNANLFAHLIAWNQENGEVRDSKVALPVIALRGEPGDGKVYYENSVAHLLLLDPRNLVRAVRFHPLIEGHQHKDGAASLLRKGIEEYLRVREANRPWWDRTALQHRASLKTLYALNHIKPSPRAQGILFKKEKPHGSVFEAVKMLRVMTPQEAAGAILNYKIPFTIAIGAIGGVKNVDVILALVEGMSGAELITNSKMLTKLGVMNNPALKAAYENAILKAQKDKKVSSLKAGRAAEMVTDQKVKAKLERLQEAKLEDLKQIEGDWLILADKSGSMERSMEKAKEIGAFLTKVIKGKVYLVFFDTIPYFFDISGETLEKVKKMTAPLLAQGATSIGCGLALIADKDILVNGIIICSDGGENRYPKFVDAYKSYEKKFDISPNVYLLHVEGESDYLSPTMRDIPYEKFEVSEIDYYGLPNLAKLLRSSRYTLIDEIMQMSLLTINQVLRKEAT